MIPGSLRAWPLVLLLACSPAPPVSPDPLPPWDGGTTWGEGGRLPMDEYERACANLEKQGCPEAHPEGTPCPDSLRRVASSPGLGITPACIEAAADRAALLACHVRCGAR